jgi:hypothetical protein
MLPFVSLMLTGELALLDEPTKVSKAAAVAAFPADGPEFIGS